MYHGAPQGEDIQYLNSLASGGYGKDLTKDQAYALATHFVIDSGYKMHSVPADARGKSAVKFNAKPKVKSAKQQVKSPLAKTQRKGVKKPQKVAGVKAAKKPQKVAGVKTAKKAKVARKQQKKQPQL